MTINASKMEFHEIGTYSKKIENGEIAEEGNMDTAQILQSNVEQLKQLFLKDKWAATECAEQLSPLRATLADQIAALEKSFYEQNAELIETQKAFEESAAGREKELRDFAINYFNETGEKTFDENLSVQVRTKFVYEVAEAVAWAETNAPALITKAVEKKAFEALVEKMPVDFVKKETSVSAVLKGLK